MPDLTDPKQPNVDLQKVADEFKDFLNEKKLDLVDYADKRMCLIPNPDEAPVPMPETAKFVEQWESLYDYADEVTEDDGKGFPHTTVSRFEDESAEIGKIINDDEGFWEAVREEVIPLYDRSPDYGWWKRHWKGVEVFYNSTKLPLVVTKVIRNNNNEVVRREVVKRKVVPPGFVIRVLHETEVEKQDA